MFLEILVAMVIGIAFGIFTGMIPGVHINLVAAMILSVSPFLVQYVSPLPIAAGIMAMSITHVFIDFIPSIFLGAPSETTALAVLPGHRLLMEGRGFEAVFLSAIGGFLGVIAIVILLPLIMMGVTQAFPILKPHIGIILVAIVFYNVLREKGFKNRMWVVVVIVLAGALGVLTLNIPNLGHPLLPLLAGLFGISTLIASTLKNSEVPIQVTECREIKKTSLAKSVSAGAFSGGLIGIFPALGPAQAAMLARELIGKSRKEAVPYNYWRGQHVLNAFWSGNVVYNRQGKKRFNCNTFRNCVCRPAGIPAVDNDCTNRLRLFNHACNTDRQVFCREHIPDKLPVRIISDYSVYHCSYVLLFAVYGHGNTAYRNGNRSFYHHS